MRQTPGLAPNMVMITCLVLFLASRPKRRELVFTGAIAAVLMALFGITPDFRVGSLQAFSYCGAGALITTLILCLSGRSNWLLAAKLAFPPAFSLITAGALSGIMVVGITYDNFLYAFDGSLGFQPSFWAGRMLRDIPGMAFSGRLLYDALPLFLATAYIAEERRGGHAARDIILFLVSLAVCGAACFQLFPAIGSIYLYPGAFPSSPPSIASIPIKPQWITVTAPRNCMPSLHTAWALAFLWTSRRFVRPLRWIAILLTGIMLLQTLAFHYLADMIVAVPFTLAFYALTRTTIPWRNRERWGSAAFGIGLVLAWFVALRWMTGMFTISAAIPWLASILTVGASWRLKVKLEKVECRPEISVAEKPIAVAAGI